MKIFRAVVDSSCIIALSQVGHFELLRELFLEVYIPDAVYDEVVVKGEHKIGAEETYSAIKNGWLLKKNITDRLAVQALTTILGQGESEVIVLCKKSGLDYALIDDRIARNMAEIMEVNTMGTIGIIDLAVKCGMSVNKKEIIARLKGFGFRISNSLYQKIISDL